MAKAAAKKKPAAPRKPAARKTPAKKPATKPRTPPGGILGDVLSLKLGLRASFEAMLAKGVGEERLLAYVAIACIAAFLAGLPAALDIAATMPGENAVVGLVAGRFVAVVIFGSLFLYGIAALSHWFCYWGFGGQGTFKGARLALFWALFLGIPLSLLQAIFGQALPALGLTSLIQPIGIVLFVFWLWLWTSFLAIAEGFARGAVFLLAIAVCACLTGVIWLLNATG